MSEEKQSSVPSSVLGKRRRDVENDSTNNPPKKRIKLSPKEDAATIKHQLKLKKYKIIKYSQDDSKSHYQFVVCVIDAVNSIQYAKGFDGEDFDKDLFVNIILSIGETPYTFICVKCYEKGVIHPWKYNTSSRNFFTHQKQHHHLICEKIDWKMEDRLRMLQPTLSYVAWDRNSFNELKGDGLKELVGAAYNLGCIKKTPVKSIGMCHL